MAVDRFVVSSVVVLKLKDGVSKYTSAYILILVVHVDGFIHDIYLYIYAQILQVKHS